MTDVPATARSRRRVSAPRSRRTAPGDPRRLARPGESLRPDDPAIPVASRHSTVRVYAMVLRYSLTEIPIKTYFTQRGAVPVIRERACRIRRHASARVSGITEHGRRLAPSVRARRGTLRGFDVLTMPLRFASFAACDRRASHPRRHPEDRLDSRSGGWVVAERRRDLARIDHHVPGTHASSDRRSKSLGNPAPAQREEAIWSALSESFGWTSLTWLVPCGT